MVTHSSILAWEIPWTRGVWWVTVHGHKRVAYNLTTKQQQTISYHFDQDFFCFEKENTWTTFKKWDKDITKIHINEK